MVCLAPGARVEALAARVAYGVVDAAEQAEARLAEGRGVAFHFRRCRTVGLGLFCDGQIGRGPAYSGLLVMLSVDGFWKRLRSTIAGGTA